MTPTAKTPKTRRTPFFFPPSLLHFPRTRWPYSYNNPVFFPNDEKIKCLWAARSASERWIKAFSEKDLGSIDEADFAMAVLDKVDEV